MKQTFTIVNIDNSNSVCSYIVGCIEIDKQGIYIFA